LGCETWRRSLIISTSSIAYSRSFFWQSSRVLFFWKRFNGSVYEEASRRFKSWRSGNEDALPPYLRRVVFAIVLRENPTDDNYDTVFKTYRLRALQMEKNLHCLLLGRSIVLNLFRKTSYLVKSSLIVPSKIFFARAFVSPSSFPEADS
jgi:hypothetical protein